MVRRCGLDECGLGLGPVVELFFLKSNEVLLHLHVK
jgi:hypothetical protein